METFIICMTVVAIGIIIACCVDSYFDHKYKNK